MQSDALHSLFQSIKDLLVHATLQEQKEEMPSDRIVSVNLLRLPSYLCSNTLHRDRHVLSVGSV